MPDIVGRNHTTLVTLTERGRAVLEAAPRERGNEPRQSVDDLHLALAETDATVRYLFQPRTP